MPNRSLASQAERVAISVLFLISTCYSLKCRTDDGPSETELKRITRNCMRKIGENAHSGNGGSMGSATNNKHYGPLHQSNFGTQYNSNTRYDYNDYNDYDDDNDRYNGNSNNNNYNNNNNNNNGNYDRNHGNRNVLQQRNRERQQNNRADSSGSSASSSSSSMGNNNGAHYDNGNGNGNGGGGGNGGSNGGSNGGNRNSNNSGRNSGSTTGDGGSNNQRGHSQNNSNSNNKNRKNTNNDTADAACVVHCFFEAMNMLNSDDYPDRYKVQYGLTRELRDRELSNFYTDTIQDCFHYVETQRRRDKCHYSRDLIHCMSEYAKVNCDDWQEFNMVFN